MPSHSDAQDTSGFLTYKPYFDYHTNRYYNVICVNTLVSGPLNSLIKRIYMPPISTYKNHTHEEHCYYVLQNDYSSNFQYYTLNQLESLFLFMKQNKYTIHHEFHSQHIPLAHTHICMFSYTPS